MIEFVTVFLLFLAAHVVPMRTGLRDVVIRRLGRGFYLAGYSIISLLLLIWLLMAATRAPYLGLWPTTPATVVIAMILMLGATILFACGVTRANPVSISFNNGPFCDSKPGIFALTHHPILWAFFLWSVAHCIVNGDAVSVVLFAAFAIFSLLGRRALERRAARSIAKVRFDAIMASTSGSFGVRLRRAMSARLAIEILLGFVVFTVLLGLHGWAIGVDPLAHFG